MVRYTVEGNMKDPEGIIRRRIIHNLGNAEAGLNGFTLVDCANADRGGSADCRTKARSLQAID
jgi:hypothetical protein